MTQICKVIIITTDLTLKNKKEQYQAPERKN